MRYTNTRLLLLLQCELLTFLSQCDIVIVMSVQVIAQDIIIMFPNFYLLMICSVDCLIAVCERVRRTVLISISIALARHELTMHDDRYVDSE